ncbi:hypothetical protein BT96DRAFT_993398 [Gymnopus androsaceus JB14]|uniref:Uncharacterized protein n=1 Tax=Gymnopus androsaceus JB14 TaxID=1447944 RepID=A0A6A4HNN5_9AGAR|nr:hypothetical protein BT96DRAFT_993398 [Gymnopus androsaceus JB14]
MSCNTVLQHSLRVRQRSPTPNTHYKFNTFSHSPTLFQRFAIPFPTSFSALYKFDAVLRHMPFNITGPNECPRCRKALISKYSEGGQYSGHYYISCFNDFGCRFFHAFPKEDAQRALADSWTPRIFRKNRCPTTKHNCPMCGCSASGHSLDPPHDNLHPHSPSNSQISLSHFSFQTPVPNHEPSVSSTLFKCHSRSSCTGHLNVITDNDMIRIVPHPRVPPELALIDCTLEELEADEPDWDMPWHRRSPASSSVSPVKKRARATSSSSSRSLPSSPLPSLSGPCSQSSPPPAIPFPVLPWPSGLTVADVSDAFHQIFDNESPSLSPRQHFKTQFGEEWNPDMFYLHYDLWKALSKDNLKAGQSLDWVSYVQSCNFAL